jgi:hypothetical protein
MREWEFGRAAGRECIAPSAGRIDEGRKASSAIVSNAEGRADVAS